MKTNSGISTRTCRVSLNCEQLESRCNPSNVGVSFLGGNLVIAGGNAPDQITLYQNLAGQFYIFGGTNTLINGRGAISLGVIHPINITIVDGNGGDSVAVYGVHAANSIAIYTGNGNDVVNLNGVQANTIAVNVQEGNNTLITQGVVARVSAAVVAGIGRSIWFDTSFAVGRHLTEFGWSEIIH